MTHALVTIVCPLAESRIADAEIAIAALGNPANEAVATVLGGLDDDGRSGTHFASLHVIRSTGDAPPYLLFEFSADGSEEAAVTRIDRTAGAALRSVFALASDWTEGVSLAAYLGKKTFQVGGGWFDQPGMCFDGTPDLSVGQIQADRELATTVAGLLAAQPAGWLATQRVAAIRAAIAAQPRFKDVLEATPADPPFVAPTTLAAITRLGGRFALTYLWPVALLVLAAALAVAITMSMRAAPSSHPVWRFAAVTAGSLVGGTLAALVVVAIVAVAGYAIFTNAEARDPVDDRAPDPAVNAAMFEHENRGSQNHMISITRRKPGLIRSFTSRLVFWGLAQAAGYTFPAGFLGSIGSIHFARWVTPPGTRDVVFLSNYGGSWESYLEDFITRAHQGLTGVWSNSIGFPRSTNLVGKGATDGERFKRYARRSMIPTLFWFSAYPTLTTAQIRTNARVRHGLAGLMTEDEAADWLALFGSAHRPAAKLVSSGIQSLLLGGLGFLRAGTCLVFDLPDDVARARRWLDAVRPLIAFDDGRRLGRDAVVTLALGAGGLARLGLGVDALASFPFAFVEGMNNPARNRMLGDIGDSAPAQWRWGEHAPDVALLVYGEDAGALAALEATLDQLAITEGIGPVHRIPLNDVTPQKTEPFGFVDGISQPIIRGTYKSFRTVDPIHLVEPGEFILGYPDNRDNLPPGPTLAAVDDPRNLLPLVGGVTADGDASVVDAPRDVGFNGSFLVIRELEQDVDGFRTYCDERAAALRDDERFAPPYDITADFIAAKIVGRWRDGSSLVRFPYNPRTHRGTEQPTNAMIRPESRPADGASAVVPPVTAPAGGDNDFLFGSEDPEALRCPFGAHIRRANPRDSLDPGSADQIDISNRHRIIRVGRSYRAAADGKPGLLFMCLNGDLERQFEFLQQTWLRSPSFHGLSSEKDPLLGDAEANACAFTIPSRDGPVRLAAVPQFVTTRGGGYFFVPGKRLIDFLRQPLQ